MNSKIQNSNTSPSLWLTLGILALIGVIYFIIEQLNGRFQLVDFEVYYKAATRAISGENLYRPEEDGFFRYKYSITAALFFIPLSVLPLFASKVCYWFLLTFTMVFGYRLLHTLTARPFQSKIYGPLLLTGILGLVSTELELHLGQVNFIILSLLLGTAYFYKKQKQLSAALLWAISIFLKPFGLILLPYFIVRKEFKLLGFFFSLATLLFFLPILFYGWTGLWEQTQLWMQELSIEMSKKQDLLQEANHTIFSVIARYTPLAYITFSDSIIKIYQLVLLSSLGLIVLFAMRKTKDMEDHIPYDFAYLIALIPMLSFTDKNAFLFVLPLIFMLLINFHKLPKLAKFLSVLGLFLYGGNVRELWMRIPAPGYDNAALCWDALSFITIGSLLVWSIFVFFIHRSSTQ
ncbi:MAG: DUF2029 domain-containing protein [Aureispira sp.]|nr:DUF2029 domain-containing protein [Aureispira sp.]